MRITIPLLVLAATAIAAPADDSYVAVGKRAYFPASAAAGLREAKRGIADDMIAAMPVHHEKRSVADDMIAAMPVHHEKRSVADDMIAAMPVHHEKRGVADDMIAAMPIHHEKRKVPPAGSGKTYTREELKAMRSRRSVDTSKFGTPALFAVGAAPH